MKSTLPIPYMVTAPPGLEAVSANEIEARIIDATESKIERGKVYFRSAMPLTQLLSLRSADNVYRVIDQFTVGLHRLCLPDISNAIALADLSFLDLAAVPGNGYTFTVNGSRMGRHTFSRFEAAEAAAKGIAKLQPLWTQGDPQNHNLEFRLDLMEEKALFSLRLSDKTMRFRGSNRYFAPAALRPTVAHAMIWLSSPLPRDRFLDPCCGSGTFITERMHYPAAGLWGGDLSETAVQTARSNLRDSLAVHDASSLPFCEIRHWDARELPFDAGSVDCIVSNLPFDKQIAADGGLAHLYRGVLKEMARVLTPDGRAILLAEDDELISRAAERSGLDCMELAKLSLKGLHPSIFRLAIR